MPSLKEVFEQRQKVGKDMLALRDKHATTQGDWPADDDAAFERMSTEYNALQKTELALEEERLKVSKLTERRELFDAIEKDLKRGLIEPGRDDYDGRKQSGDDGTQLALTGRDRLLALQGWLRSKTDDGPTQEQIDAAKRCRVNLLASKTRLRILGTDDMRHRSGGWVANDRFEPPTLNRAGLVVGTGSAGGYTVPADFVGMLEEQILTVGGPRGVASIIRTSNGAALKWPGVDDTGNTGEQLDEQGSIGSTVDPTFSEKTWNAYKMSSKLVKISEELLEDSPFNLAVWIAGALGERLGRITTSKYTTGSGSSTPQGVTVGISAGVTAAAVNAITGDELLSMTHSIDPGYRVGPSVGWMMHDNIVLAVRKLKDGQGNYLWTMGGLVGVPDRLAGYPLTINQYMASSLAASAKAAIFGNFAKYGIRDVNSIRMKRVDELYAATDEVGFIAFLRTDAKWINTAAAKTLVMAAS